jgi:predicted DNA-binding protein
MLDQDFSAIIARGGQGPELPAPDTDEPMKSVSLRLPLDLEQAIRAAAAARGIPHTTLMRQFIEAGMAGLDAEQYLVPLADAQRLLASLATHQRRGAA